MDDAVDAIGEFMEDYSANLVELQEKLDSLERREINNKTSLQLTTVDADNEWKRKIEVARTQYKKVKAKVEEERIDLLKRMRDGQAWETIKANFKMACKKDSEQESGRGRRERSLLEPFGEEILAEAKEQEAAEPEDEEAIEDFDIMGDPEVINTNTDTDTNTELNVEIDQETGDMANSESVSHSVWSRLSGYFRR